MPTPAKLPETQGGPTPGPWKAKRYVGHEPNHSARDGADWPGTIVAANGTKVYTGPFCFRSLRGKTVAEAEANARLMAASPDLLAALQAVMFDPDMLATFETATRRKGIYADKSIPEFNKWCKRTAAIARQLRAAIALATKGRAL